jgi:hypothetical protein
VRPDLPLIVILAVVQGWALYALHHSIQSHHWPATDPAWLIALYCIALFVPVTLQLLLEHFRRKALWLGVAILGGAFFYFGWHHGSAIVDPRSDRFVLSGKFFPLAFVLVVWWLHVLPFAQNRLTAPRWSDYGLLFQHAWRNVISLAEAGLFTGLFWLILELWQALFHMLGIDFFRELFRDSMFVYPVTAVAFGCALHLIGSIDRLISAVLEQILNVLKWLATVAGALLVLFTVALVLKLPGLVFTGQRAIGATWLLWLVAVVVLLLNAAYRDGTVDRPYPGAVALALRVATPLLVIVAATAFYALIVRAQRYGLTVDRVWAFVVAGAALLYSVGYSLAAFDGVRWLGGIARVNVAVALALIATMALALTPILSPYRLAANSQYRLVLDGRYATPKGRIPGATPFIYLRFDAGEYGRQRLSELADLQNHPGAELIRQVAAQALRQEQPWGAAPVLDAAQRVARLTLYPADHMLDANLSARLVEDWRRPGSGLFSISAGETMAGVFADLNGDGVDEFVVLTATGGGPVYAMTGGQWREIGRVFAPQHWPANADKRWAELSAGLASGAIAVTPSQWNDLTVGGHRFEIRPQN